MKRHFLQVLGLLSIVGFNQAMAASVSSNLPVTASVLASCAVGTIGSIAFGVYDRKTPTPTDAQGSIVVDCVDNLPFNVGLGQGLGIGASSANPRFLTGPIIDANDLLEYGLYQDMARNVSWGDTIGTNTVAGIGDPGNPSLVVYGRIPPGQEVPAGNFSDSVLITVTF